MSQDTRSTRWICLECHYVYDPARGDKSQNIAVGTSFEALPDTWRCPECKIFKTKSGVFKPL